MEIESLKVEKFMEDVFDLIYPVGSYYETSDTSFNPNTSWGGTWNKTDTDGRVTVAQSTTDEKFMKVGYKWGETSHVLTESEMPSHKHSLTSWRNPTESTPQATTGYGFTSNNYAFSNVATDGDGTSYTANDSVAIGASGRNASHNNLQPYIVVVRWHRTA